MTSVQTDITHNTARHIGVSDARDKTLQVTFRMELWLTAPDRKKQMISVWRRSFSNFRILSR